LGQLTDFLGQNPRVSNLFLKLGTYIGKDQNMELCRSGTKPSFPQAVVTREKIVVLHDVHRCPLERRLAYTCRWLEKGIYRLREVLIKDYVQPLFGRCIMCYVPGLDAPTCIHDFHSIILLSDPRFPRVVVGLLPLLISSGPSFCPSDIPWDLLYHQVATVIL
jgi:hypothetical protein